MPEDWSEIDPAHEAMAMAALRGLFRGDLAPLVAYLRSDFEIDPVIRTNLADLIEGVDGLPYQVTTERDGRAAQKLETARLDWKIIRFVHEVERRRPGREAAVVEAVDKFGEPERRIWRALARVRGIEALDRALAANVRG